MVRTIPMRTFPKGRFTTMLNFNSSRLSARFMLLALVALSALLLSSVAFAQTSISTGSIVGNVTDSTGAVLPNAKVTITGPTGQTLHATTNGTGSYSLGALIPGVYSLRVEAKGFKTAQLSLNVQVDNAANGSLKLEIGQESTVVEVQGSEVQVNTEQATVQGVLTASQIENLPVNGRNFLDLAQLEPGVQFRTVRTSIQRRLVTPLFHSAAVMAGPPALRLTAWTSPTRPLERPRLTFQPAV